MTQARMHADEVRVDAALVRRLLGRQFPRWAGLPLAAVPSTGTDHALFRLGDELLVRLPRIHWAVDDVHKERRWLPRLAPQLPAEVPTPVAVGGPGDGYRWPWSIYRWIEGEPPRVGALTAADALAGELAAFVLALQRLDTTGAPAAGRGGRLAEQDAETRRALTQLQGQVDSDIVTAAWEDGLGAAPWTGAPVWVHGDLKPDNLLCRGGRLHAVIDFGGLGIGDPAVDMLVAWTLLPARARAAYRRALGVDADTWRRGRARALSVALIQLPYYQHTNPALAANARHVIAEVLEDLRSES